MVQLSEARAVSTVHYSASATEVSQYFFAVRLLLLVAICALLRGGRVCKLRRSLFGPADGLWIAVDAVLCANPFLRVPDDSATQLRELYTSARLSLFLFGAVPLFLVAAERKRRGLAVLLVAVVALQRSATAMVTKNPVHALIAALTVRPVWLAATLLSTERSANPRLGATHVV